MSSFTLKLDLANLTATKAWKKLKEEKLCNLEKKRIIKEAEKKRIWEVTFERGSKKNKKKNHGTMIYTNLIQQ